MNKEHLMHTPTKLISILVLTWSAIGSAGAQTKEEEHKAHHPKSTATAAMPTPVADMASKPGGMHDMHDMHERHQKEMKKIHGTKDPAKRQKLMDKHMKEMHEHMDKHGGMDKPTAAKSTEGAASK
jgi:hypothetical protein